MAKNMDADGGNPNLYNSIEDLKIDHLYDEIKHKGMVSLCASFLKSWVEAAKVVRLFPRLIS